MLLFESILKSIIDKVEGLAKRIGKIIKYTKKDYYSVLNYVDRTKWRMCRGKGDFIYINKNPKKNIAQVQYIHYSPLRLNKLDNI